MLIVEQGVQPPSGNAKYPFESMKVGDSFASNGPKDYRISNAASKFVARHLERTGERWKFRTRTVGGETRCWRIQ